MSLLWYRERTALFGETEPLPEELRELFTLTPAQYQVNNSTACNSYTYA